MARFIKILAIFAILPISVISIISLMYCYRDPYADFGIHANYQWEYRFQQLGDLGTKKLLYSLNDYNSFIFGSSRATSIYACYLQSRIAGSRFFHYAQWNETIGGIYAKLRLLEEKRIPIKNIVICIDTDFTFVGNGECTPQDHFILTGKNKILYLGGHYYDFIRDIDSDKIRILIGKHRLGGTFTDRISDPATNDFNHICTQGLPEKYKKPVLTQDFIDKIDKFKKSGFYFTRSDTQRFARPQIGPFEIALLRKISALLKRQDANYYILITPLYDQVKFCYKDKKVLDYCFGSHIHDFSGKNSITDNEYNYHDRKHYHPYIAKRMIDAILDGTEISL